MSADLLTHPAREALAAVLLPFVEAGALTPLELHAVDTLGALANEADPDVLLALALALRAPGRGHICTDLRRVQPSELLPEDADAELGALLTLPHDREAWVARVADSPLVGEGQPFVLEGGWVYTTRYHRYESQLAHTLSQRFHSSRAPADSALLRRGLASLFAPRSGLDRQQLAAAMAALRGFTVISGGPGTGKTHTVSRVLTLLWAQALAAGESPPRVALAAPTGKAAARMKESIDNGLAHLLADCADALPPGAAPADLGAFLGKLVPATLHRLLGYQAHNPTRFRHHAGNPLPYDIVLVDEASMVDFAMMAKLVDATAPSARLLLLGDKHQLASVEAGTVLADIAGPVRPQHPTASADFQRALEQLGLPTGELGTAAAPGPQDGVALLTESRRFTDTSGIGHFAAACLAEPIDPQAAIDVLTEGRDDVALIAHAEGGRLAPALLKQLTAGYRPYLALLFAGPAAEQSRTEHHAAVLRAFERFRVLAAHRRGRLGVEGLNRAVAEQLSIAFPQLDTRPRHYLGQPVLVRRNDPTVGRYNGDIGLLVTDDDGELVVAFPAPHGVDYLNPARLPEHQTVFAMTIHKSQGSEFEHALVVLPDAPSPLLTRELVYTGVTRAKKRMTLVGSPDVLADGLQRTVQRASGLRRKLWDEPTTGVPA